MNERRQPIDPDSWDPPPRTKKSHRDRWEWLRNGCGTPDDRRNQVRLLGFMALWMLVFTAAAQTLKGNLDLGFPVEGWTALALAALPNALALVVLFAYLRFLRMTDELTRLIQIQGLAIGFGAWFFLSFGWQLFEFAGAPAPSNDVALVLPTFAMAFGQVYLSWKYR